MKQTLRSICALAALFAVCGAAGAEEVDDLTFPAAIGDKVSLFGNRFGQDSMYGFGVASNTLVYKAFRFHKWFVNESNANSTPDMFLRAGRLGIGTNDVNHELVVQGNDPVFQIRDDQQDNSGAAARIELLERAGGNFNGGGYIWWNGQTNRMLFGTKNSGSDTNVMVIDRATHGVGIGTQNPGSFRLAVNGRIRAKEIVVEAGWSDYVFEDGYDLKPLPEVKAFIEAHGHLPDVPSAATVAADGVRLGESQSTLLRKIEELTLHLIAMDERLAALAQENADLRARVAGPGTPE